MGPKFKIIFIIDPQFLFVYFLYENSIQEHSKILFVNSMQIENKFNAVAEFIHLT